MTRATTSMTSGHGEHHPAAHDRLDDLAWAAFLIGTGVIWLLPSHSVPEGTWLIGTGVILLLLNAGRYVQGRKISGFTTLLGTLALIGGLSDFVGIHLPLLALSLIAVGAIIIVKPLLTRRS